MFPCKKCKCKKYIFSKKDEKTMKGECKNCGSIILFDSKKEKDKKREELKAEGICTQCKKTKLEIKIESGNTSYYCKKCKLKTYKI